MAEKPSVSSKVHLLVKIGENIYEFLCANSSALGEVHDALVSMKSHIVELIAATQKAEEQPTTAPEA